jgi:hypothetical protein
MTLKNNVKIGSLLFKIRCNNDLILKITETKKNIRIYNYGFTKPFLHLNLFYFTYLYNYIYLFLYILLFILYYPEIITK